MNPVEWIELSLEELEELPELRWLDCPLYEDCLDRAAEDERWEGWTCLYCEFQDEHRKEEPNGRISTHI